MGRLTTKYDSSYMPTALKGIGRLFEIDDCEACFEYCKMVHRGHTRCETCEIRDCFNKLGRYEELEEHGKLLKLPCTVGDTVYELQETRHRIQSLEIISVNIGRMGKPYFNWELKDGIGIYLNSRGFGVSELGKTVFLTKEAAEKALKEMEDRKNGEIDICR